MSSVQLGDKNRVTLPPEMIPEGVSRFDVEKTDDGRIILTPLLEIPANQAWFWSPKWQEGEKEASADIKAGRMKQATAKQIMAEIRNRRKRKK